MPEVVHLEARIRDAVGEAERVYENVLKKVREMKDKINELELRLSEKGLVTRRESGALDSAMENLNRLTDSLIRRSEETEEKYKRLEQNCRAHMISLSALDDLRAICGKLKELAMNLLCFSLAHFRQRP